MHSLGFFLLAFTSLSAWAEVPATNGLRAHLKQLCSAARGRVGIAITLLHTGESIALRGDEPFPMQSVYKLPIAMATLDQVDRGVVKLEQKVRVSESDFVSAQQHSPIRDRHSRGVELSLKELLRLMVSESDGTACDVLLRVIGGPRAAHHYIRSLGVDGIVIATTEKEMGRDEKAQYRNWASPNAMVALLRALHAGRGLSPASRVLLWQWMTDTPTGARRLKGLLPAGTVVVHKTGSSRTVNGLTAATNDVGIILMPNGRYLAIAVFVSDSTADQASREAVIAEVARAAWEFWDGQEGGQLRSTEDKEC